MLCQPIAKSKSKAAAKTRLRLPLRYEIIYCFQQADKFKPPIVILEDETYEAPRDIKNPFTKEPNIGVANINYDLIDLVSQVRSPEKPVCV